MGQIGEFSFILAKVGLDEGLITEYLFELTIVIAIATMLVTPLMMRIDRPLVRLLSRLPLLEPAMASGLFGPRVRTATRAVEAHYSNNETVELAQHVIICGYGEVGRNLAKALETKGLTYFVIDYDPHVIVELHRKGIGCTYGDASSEEVLRQVNLPKARILAVTFNDPIAAELTVRRAKALAHRVDIIVRVQESMHLQPLYDTGASEVVQPHFETALEIIRHTLHRYGFSGPEIQLLVSHLREEHYKRPRGLI